jgi:hypothetical protein
MVLSLAGSRALYTSPMPAMPLVGVKKLAVFRTVSSQLSKILIDNLSKL